MIHKLSQKAGKLRQDGGAVAVDVDLDHVVPLRNDHLALRYEVELLTKVIEDTLLHPGKVGYGGRLQQARTAPTAGLGPVGVGELEVDVVEMRGSRR